MHVYIVVNVLNMKELEEESEGKISLVHILTYSLVSDKFAHFTLHDCQCFSSLLFFQQTKLPQVCKRQQMLYTITLNERQDMVSQRTVSVV